MNPEVSLTIFRMRKIEECHARSELADGVANEPGECRVCEQDLCRVDVGKRGPPTPMPSKKTRDIDSIWARAVPDIDLRNCNLT